MSFIHDVIKIKYIEEGYLPNYPYHLISDKEMCRAFIGNTENYFDDNYPCIDNSLRTIYDELVSNIMYHMDLLENSKDSNYVLPNWVYSYMIGSTLGPESDKLDIHDMLVYMGLDNLNDEFNVDICNRCYEISKLWLRKYPADTLDHRSPSIFGEPIVMKYLRLQNSY